MALDFPSQPGAVRTLRAALKSGRLHHAYLLSGIPGVGVHEFGERFAEGLLCPTDPEGCGECPNCDRAKRRLHPDLLTVSLTEGAKDVRVEAIRDLCGALQLKPAEAGRKVALIADAELMSPGAQNALLKTLEEPPPSTVLVLTTEAEDRLLPTIRSRCIRVRLEFGTAASVLTRDDKGLPQRRERVIGHFETLLREGSKPGAAAAAIELAESSADGREEAKETLEILAACLRDLLFLRAGVDSKWLFAPEKAKAFAAIAEKRSEAQLLRGLDRIAEASVALEGNASPRLQMEAAALRLSGLA